MTLGAVITVSDRSARGERADETGPFVVGQLREAGFDVADARVVPDGADPVGGAIVDAISTGAAFVVTLGGTGISPRDLTPEGTAPLLTAQLPGVPEEIRRFGMQNTPTAALSRGLAGVATVGDRRAFVVNLAGSMGAARDGLAVLLPMLEHIVEQLAGGDHA